MLSGTHEARYRSNSSSSMSEKSLRTDRAGEAMDPYAFMFGRVHSSKSQFSGVEGSFQGNYRFEGSQTGKARRGRAHAVQ